MKASAAMLLAVAMLARAAVGSTPVLAGDMLRQSRLEAGLANQGSESRATDSRQPSRELLTTVAHTWRQEALAENHREVARLGREFYDRLAVFAGHLDEVRKKLDGAVQAYNQAAGSFEARVLVSARRLRDLEATTAAELPPAEPIDTVPRVLRQIGLMGLPEGATTEEADGPET